MEQTDSPNCDLCGSPAYSVVYDLDDFWILRCRNCRLVYRHPRPTDTQLFDMYNGTKPVPNDDLTAYYRKFRQRTYTRMFQALRQIQATSEPLRVFDIGAGQGWSFPVIQQFGHTPLGLDISFGDCQVACKNGYVSQGKTAELPFAAGSADVILMSDVLEHVRSPRAVLREAHRVLSSQGIVIMRVPDVSGVLIRFLDVAYQITRGRFVQGGRMLYQFHLYGFCLSTLSRYLEETDFEIVTYSRERSKNLAQLKKKSWAQNPFKRWGIVVLTWLGEVARRQDELIVLARKR
jgi:ubiquinone/menaquinone biosynthesis C-methylase UbiE